MCAHPAHAGVEYRKAIAAFTAASQNYNDLAAHISHQQAARLKLLKDLASLQTQITSVRVSAELYMY